jgi:signal transduction histidine kinase/ActR/RegA family two-component response regulator
MRIRSHLLLLAFGVILPVAAFSIFLTALLVEKEQRTFADGAIERLRSTMTAIDAQVQGQIMALNALASVNELDRENLPGFAAEAARILRSQPAWLNIILATPDGRQLLNAVDPSVPKEHPYLVERDIARRAAATRMPVVGSIVTRPSNRRGVNLAVPVMRGDSVRYVLVAFVKPQLFQTTIERQRIGPGWVSGLVDSGGHFIARIPPPPAEKAGPSFLAAVARSAEGWYRGRTTEGYDAYTAHLTSGFTHWSIGLGIPADVVLAGARRTAWLMGMGIAASLALAAFLALWLGRRVARPVTRIAGAAPAIASGKAVDTAGLDRVSELKTVALALNEAAAAVRDREILVEREKQALRQADRAKDEFIAMMSHELRNPLAALTSASGVLELLPADDPRAIHSRAVIKRQTAHMARLVEDLLDTSRVIMGKAYLQPEVFNMAEAASSVIQAWRSGGRVHERRVSLETSTAWVRADRSRVEQIISNLLDNALKFSPADSLVRIRVWTESAHAHIEVSDEGIGLTPEMMERAFGLFVQSEQGLARKSGGMGIGLALVKRLTELLGGTVAVASEGEGHGAAFTVTLPAVAPPEHTSELAIKTIPFAPCRILLIDDNDDMRKTVAASLVLHGHEVREAADGAAALELASDVVPDVAIIDIGLPELSGYDVARRLRQGPLTRNIGLVALTGYGQAGDKENAAAAGFDEHLTKPVAPEVLLKTISSVRSRRRSGASPRAAAR